MLIDLYHGSDHIIEKPEYGKGELRNDYGRGFYCTENIELAKEWAVNDGNNGFVNAYELDDSTLSLLNLNTDNYDILTWLAILVHHRTYWQKHSIAEEAKDYLEKHFYIDVSKFDLIRGYRADDSYFSFAQDFIMGSISLKKLSYAMKLGKLGEQIVLKSPQAFNHITYTGFETAPADIYYELKTKRDREARSNYRSFRQSEDSKDDIYIIDILREEMLPGDARLKIK